MATNTITLLDLMQRRGDPVIDRKVVDEIADSAPLFNAMPTRSISGTTYRYMRRTSIPMIGARPLNAGAEMLKSAYSHATGECFAYDGLILIDKLIADADPAGKNALMAEEMRAVLRGTEFGLEQALFYGKARDEFGIYGLNNQIADYMTMSMNSQATASTIESIGGSSVWFLNLNNDYMELLYGNGKTINFGPEKVQDVERPTGRGSNVGSMEAYIRHCSFWLGFCLKNVWAAGRICNESANNPITDAKLAEMLRKFPANHKPTHIVMNQDTLARWEYSRTSSLKFVKDISKGGVIADTPAEFRGLKVIVTDALLRDETTANISAIRNQSSIGVDSFMKTSGMLTNPNKPE